MKHPLSLATIIAVTSLSLSGCGYSIFDAAEDISESSKGGFEDGLLIKTGNTKIASYNELSHIGPDNVIFKAGDNFTIQASGDAETIAKLRYKLKDNQLIIGREGDSWGDYDDDKAVITITAPTLNAISIAGSGNMNSEKLKNTELTLNIAGSGNAKLSGLDIETLKASIAGSGDTILNGNVTETKFSIAGSGDINAKQLKAKTIKASIAGSGNMDLFATDTVKASIAGSGDVNVSGGATCSKSVIGSGNVNC